jgi:hypothetical protein
MESYAPKDDGKNPLLKGNDPEKYARALAAAIGAQTTTKLSDMTRSQLNEMVISIGRIEGYFDKTNSAKSTGAPMPKKE